MFGFGKSNSGKLQLDQDGARERIEKAIGAVPLPGVDPAAGDLKALGVLKALSVDEGTLVVTLELPTPALHGRAAFERAVKDAAQSAAGVDIRLDVKSRVMPAAGIATGKADLPGVANVVLVASGKGGVGKSTVASNLAVALAKLGAKVGLLDADIYGPSLPTMFGIDSGTRPGTVPTADAGRPMLAPLERYGVKLMSIGFLVDTSTPMVWRGPMIASAAMQLFRDVAWGQLDYLIVDMPPGTGDVQLTISQQVVVAGAVVASTPQDVALADVVRAKAMFDKVAIPIIGVVENMSYFICDQCDKRHEIFLHGGAKAAAVRMALPFLGEVPLEPAVVAGGDSGRPVVVGHPTSVSAQAMVTVAEHVATHLANMALTMPSVREPTITITGGALTQKAGPKKGALPVVS